MCGVLGAAVNPREARKDVLEAVPSILSRLMMANHFRGGDSYGLAIVPRNGDQIRTLRRVGKFPEHMEKTRSRRPWFRHMRRVHRMLQRGVPLVAMGHNRKATHGDVNERNAMPFVYGRVDADNWVVGTHNGVLSYYKEAAEELELDVDPKDLQVDSEVIFRTIQAKDNVVETLPVLSGSGSMSIVYMKNDVNKLHFFRDTNPLHILEMPGVLIWSSAERDLRTACGEIARKVNPTEHDKHHTIDLNTLEFVESSEKIVARHMWKSIHSFNMGHGYKPRGLIDPSNRRTKTTTKGARLTRLYSPMETERCTGCHQYKNVATMLFTEESIFCGWCAVGHLFTPFDNPTGSGASQR